MKLLSAFLTETGVVSDVVDAVTEALDTTTTGAVAEVADNAAAINNGFVVAMGIGTVFFGLVCIIVLIKLMSAVTARFTQNTAAPAPAAAAAPVQAPAAPAAIENRAEIIAAVCAAAAEELGTDVSALRVVSFKKIS